MPLIVSETDIQPLLREPAQMDGAIDAVEKATVAEYQGRIRSGNLVDRTQTDRPNLLQIHLASDDAFVTGFQVFGNTIGASFPNTRFVVLLDGETRQLLALVPYEGLSPLRVGASAGVACRYLAPKGARVVGMLGSSKQARRQLQAIVRTVLTIDRVRIFSPTPEHREAFAKETSDWLGVRVDAVETPEAAVRDADIVDSSTNTRTPAFQWSWVKPGALVMPIGGGQLPEEVLTDARVVLPTWDSTTDESTGREPFGSAIRAGKYSKADIAGELGQIILGEMNVRTRDDETVVFDVGRLNMWAVAVTHWAYEWARERELGTTINLSTG